MKEKSTLHFTNINIHRDQHLDTVNDFLRREDPDVACMQEIPKKDLLSIAAVCDMDYRFVTMGAVSSHPESVPFEVGIAIFWKKHLTLRGVAALSYRNRPQIITFEKFPSISYARILLHVLLEEEGRRFHVGTTHFTWTPDGSASDEQRTDIHALLGLLGDARRGDGLLLAGDFNAPRGGEIFSMLAAEYRDNLPSDVRSTIDPKLHRAAPLILAVDTIFSTPEYLVDNVKVHTGVSDHCALTANVSRVL